MPSRRGPLTALLLACVMLVAAAAVRLQRPVHQTAVEPAPVTYRIDINHADADTLCLLPGVGPGIAEHIITRRETLGPLQTADDLESVHMIGGKTRQAIEPWVVFD
jgi:competence ComEA-like helix-hairpin-helix protein